MSKMNRLIKLNNGHMMPVIGLGTFLMSGEKLQHAVEHAVNVGMYIYYQMPHKPSLVACMVLMLSQ